MDVAIGLLIPFVGTTVGAACVFFLKSDISPRLQKIFMGFAAGVMIAASVWSLLIPAMEMCEDMERMSFLPALTGFLAGVFCLLLTDTFLPHLHVGSDKPEGVKSGFGKTALLMMAVTIHNLPEGAACGAIFAGVLNGDGTVTMAGAITLAIGIAIQNFPEGAIISMPLCSEGKSKFKSFLLGTLSGAVEPIGALLAILLANIVTPILPYMLAFAAGAMIYVVTDELIPGTSEGEHSNAGILALAVGFALMMVLDVALG